MIPGFSDPGHWIPPRRMPCWHIMKRILGYYVVPPGELWVRFDDGEMRQAACEQGLATAAPESMGALGWQDSCCRQPQTGSVSRFAGGKQSQYR